MIEFNVQRAIVVYLFSHPDYRDVIFIEDPRLDPSFHFRMHITEVLFLAEPSAGLNSFSPGQPRQNDHAFGVNAGFSPIRYWEAPDQVLQKNLYRRFGEEDRPLRRDSWSQFQSEAAK